MVFLVVLYLPFVLLLDLLHLQAVNVARLAPLCHDSKLVLDFVPELSEANI